MIKLSRKHAAILAIAAAMAVGCQTAPDEPEVDEQARDMARQAIDDAQAIIASAEEPCTDVGNAGDYLSQAEAAEAEGNFEEAQELAERAARVAQEAQDECYAEKAAEYIEKAKTFTNMTADQRDRLRRAESAYDAGNYRDAYETARALVSELKAATMNYRVERGDSLWRISGKSDVYGDPYQWPLIFRANRDKIEDADLIYPDQEFKVYKHPTQAEKDKAVDHARNRGAWQIGRVEDSDRRYLREAGSR
ncbi:LysM peptidoglycan-binding domain-containing protein [Natronospira bacteriovora]|uniref:LysM peptidoglycan-binding domain-containing protein n=1 Tax=Natronospira bacteriovora TaxID=3069753 RepID=A0ABU0W5Z6_9GAMM|nr:LysM peptidoglycan-binding domain-containing protein [Natronospira sp. AB-CW4]MDQ2069442.1 LysM peptidoglycan-binding domain-containing protein [Natronospira sp. AB-CW4]